MKTTILSIVMVLAISSFVTAQKFRALDKSPMDVAYLPDNFAHDREDGDMAIARVHYGQPQKKDRIVFGGLIPLNKVWRTGANESSEFKAYKDITIGGETLKAGTYSLFSIPSEKEWTIIFNSDVDYWGDYGYKEENDVMRVKVGVKSLEEAVEAFSIRLEDLKDGKAVMRMAWDKTMVEVPIGY